MRHESKLTVAIGTDAVVVRTHGRLGYRTARILGRERGEDGSERIWLDRVVAPYGSELGDGWHAQGAVSTILVRSTPPAIP